MNTPYSQTDMSAINAFLDAYQIESHGLAAQEVSLNEDGHLVYDVRVDTYGETSFTSVTQRETTDNVLELDVTVIDEKSLIEKLATLYAFYKQNDETFIREIQNMYKNENRI